MPRKLIRDKIIKFLKKDEYEHVKNIAELNGLYAMKVMEELDEIQRSDHKDINEFIDLIQVGISFAQANGFTKLDIAVAMNEKAIDRGEFSNIALINLNPENLSNRIYFKLK